MDGGKKKDRGDEDGATSTATTVIREGSVVMNVPVAAAAASGGGTSSRTGGGASKSRGHNGDTSALQQPQQPPPQEQPPQPQQEVFYNPVQVQNRDLSVLMLALHWERRCTRHAREQLKKRLRKDRPALSEGERQDELERRLKSWEQQLTTVTPATMTSTDAALDDDDLSSSPPPIPPPYRVLDALAASGLRSLRYWNELKGRVEHVRINDLETKAVERAHQNIVDNQLSDSLLRGNDDNVEDFSRGIRIQQGDAIDVLYQSRSSRPWSNIDLDPYGSAAPFLDGAVQAIENHGMLSVTCTDMAALGGSHPDTCFGRYHAFPLQRSGYLQEMAVRILLYRLATAAAAYGRSIRPVLSVGMDFYVRVFVEIIDSKAAVKDLALSVGHVYQSTRCPSFVVQPTAVLGGKSNRVYQTGRVPSSSDPEHFEIPDAGLKVGGPIWLGPIHDPDVVKAAMDRLHATAGGVIPDSHLLATRARIMGRLESCRDELNDVPLYYKLPDLCSTIGMSCIPRKSMEAALRNAGYRASGYHKEPQAIKTDAPNRVVWDILRTWYHQQYAPAMAAAASSSKGGGSKSAPEEGSVAHQILSKPVATPNIDFTPRMEEGSTSTSKSTGYARFPMNPEPNWGPKARAKAAQTSSSISGRNRKRTAEEAAGGGAEADVATKPDTADADKPRYPGRDAARDPGRDAAREMGRP